jgi:hypothetical protein
MVSEAVEMSACLVILISLLSVVFKSRCRFFSPTFSEGIRGEHERAMWEGLDTPPHQQVQR